MTAAILQSNYIPWKGYFDLLNSADVFIIYDEVQYTKNDWRNRNKIKTAQGLHWLTIPVKQEKLAQKINETCVNGNEWRKKHWLTITNTYRKFPGFTLYKDIFEELYLSNEEILLTKINESFIRTIANLLNSKTEIVRSEQLGLIEGKTERLVDLCKKVGASTYLSGPAAKDYLQVDLFNAEGIKVKWMDYGNYTTYEQPFPPFEHGVSVLDTLFCNGAATKQYLKSFGK